MARPADVATVSSLFRPDGAFRTRTFDQDAGAGGVPDRSALHADAVADDGLNGLGAYGRCLAGRAVGCAPGPLGGPGDDGLCGLRYILPKFLAGPIADRSVFRPPRLAA